MLDQSSDHNYYVAKINWLVSTGRDDLIDEIADQFERPTRSGWETFWTRRTVERTERRIA